MSGFSHCNDRQGLITVCVAIFKGMVCRAFAFVSPKQFNLVFGDQRETSLRKEARPELFCLGSYEASGVYEE